MPPPKKNATSDSFCLIASHISYCIQNYHISKCLKFIIILYKLYHHILLYHIIVLHHIYIIQLDKWMTSTGTCSYWNDMIH